MTEINNTWERYIRGTSYSIMLFFSCFDLVTKTLHNRFVGPLADAKNINAEKFGDLHGSTRCPTNLSKERANNEENIEELLPTHNVNTIGNEDLRIGLRQVLKSNHDDKRHK